MDSLLTINTYINVLANKTNEIELNFKSRNQVCFVCTELAINVITVLHMCNCVCVCVHACMYVHFEWKGTQEKRQYNYEKLYAPSTPTTFGDWLTDWLIDRHHKKVQYSCQHVIDSSHRGKKKKKKKKHHFLKRL